MLHHLSRTFIAKSLKLPTLATGGALPQRGQCLVFQPTGFTQVDITAEARALLPHDFTLTPAEAMAVSFLWHFPYL